MIQPVPTTTPGIFRCPHCGLQNPRPTPSGKPFQHDCPKAPALTPLLARLADVTGHPEIVDDQSVYARAVQQWAAGVVVHTADGREADRIEPFGVRSESEVEFVVKLCEQNVCGKFRNGFCRSGCGPGMLVEVKARMASEGCPWTGKHGKGPLW